MILTTNPDIASIDALLHRWEVVEYIATGLVILGCAGEFVADFTNIRTSEWRHGKLGKASLLLLIVALAVELGALVRINGLSGKEIAILNSETAFARQKQVEAEQEIAILTSETALARQKQAEAELALERERTERQKAVTQLHDMQEEISRDLAKAKNESKGPEAVLKVQALQLTQDIFYYVTKNSLDEVQWKRVSAHEYANHIEELKKGFGKQFGQRIEQVLAAMRAEHLEVSFAINKCMFPQSGNPLLENDTVVDDMMACASGLVALSQELP